MTLEETIPLMTSDDYKERFKAEYFQLQFRFCALSDAIDAYDEGKLPFAPKCEIEDLRTQCHYMQCYLALMMKRAKVEGIELELVMETDYKESSKI